MDIQQWIWQHTVHTCTYPLHTVYASKLNMHTYMADTGKYIYIILTSSSLAVSIPLTNTVKPHRRAIERFKWTLLCPPLNAAFLFYIQLQQFFYCIVFIHSKLTSTVLNFYYINSICTYK